LTILQFLNKIKQGYELKEGKLISESLTAYLQHHLNHITFRKHPLGFFYHNMVGSSEFEEYRLHFWSDYSVEQDEFLKIHDHSFDFTSYVLSGKLTNRTYALSQSDSFEGYVYEVIFRNNVSSLVISADRCGLELLQSKEFAKGDFYDMASAQFHNTISKKGSTVTIIRIDRSQSKVSRVFSPNKLQDTTTQYDRLLLSKKQNLTIANTILGMI